MRAVRIEQCLLIACQRELGVLVLSCLPLGLDQINSAVVLRATGQVGEWQGGST